MIVGDAVTVVMTVAVEVVRAVVVVVPLVEAFGSREILGEVVELVTGVVEVVGDAAVEERADVVTEVVVGIVVDKEEDVVEDVLVPLRLADVVVTPVLVDKLNVRVVVVVVVAELIL